MTEECTRCGKEFGFYELMTYGKEKLCDDCLEEEAKQFKEDFIVSVKPAIADFLRYAKIDSESFWDMVDHCNLWNIEDPYEVEMSNRQFESAFGNCSSFTENGREWIKVKGVTYFTRR